MSTKMIAALPSAHAMIQVLAELPGLKIARARQTLTIGTADMEIAGHIHVPVNSPVADVRRVFNSPDGTVMTWRR